MYSNRLEIIELLYRTKLEVIENQYWYILVLDISSMLIVST